MFFHYGDKNNINPCLEQRSVVWKLIVISGTWLKTTNSVMVSDPIDLNLKHFPRRRPCPRAFVASYDVPVHVKACGKNGKPWGI